MPTGRTVRIPYHSKSSDAVYELIADAETGRAISCPCKGWINSKAPKGCTHTKQQNAKAGLPENGRETTETRVNTLGPDPTAPAPRADRINPQLAQAMPAGKTFESYIGDPEWALEEKLDGHRVMVRVPGAPTAAIDAWSRPRAGGNGPLTRELPPQILKDLAHLPACVLDGELRLPGGKAWDVTRTDLAHRLVYTAFDIVECMGMPVAHLPDRQRRQYLEMVIQHLTPEGALLDALPSVQIIPRVDVSQAALDEIRGRGGEGAMLRRLNAPWRAGHRSDAWVKVKPGSGLPYPEVETVITHFEAGKFGPCSVTHVQGTIDGEAFTTAVKTLDTTALRDCEAGRIGKGTRLVIGYVELIEQDATISRKKGASRIQLRHPMWKRVLR